MKKAFVKVMALAMAFGLSFAVVGCGGGSGEAKAEKSFINELGGVSETYVGTVSEQNFDTAEKAAQSFVTNEVVGEKEISVVNTESKASYEGANIATLGLPEAVTSGATAVEQIEVEYKESEVAAMASAPSASSKRVTVYVIKYESNWKYYTPCPETGDTILKSYYDSVFNAEKYKNCTLNSTMDMSYNIKASGGGMSFEMKMSMKMTQTILYEPGKLYYELSSVTTQSMMGESDNKQEVSLKAYFETTDDGISCWVDSGTGWMNGSIQMIGVSDLDELAPFSDDYLDYTYFTKTDYGFALDKKHAEQYLKEAVGSEIEDILESLGDSGFSVDMFGKYYVSEGVLSGMRLDADVNMKASEEGTTMKLTMNIGGETKCTNYGTTTVTKPSGIA